MATVSSSFATGSREHSPAHHLYSSAYTQGEKFQTLGDPVHTFIHQKYAQIFRKHEDKILRDSVYSAVFGMYEYESIERLQSLQYLFAKGFEERGAGLKDPDTVWRFMNDLEDGKHLDSIEILSEDVAVRKQQKSRVKSLQKFPIQATNVVHATSDSAAAHGLVRDSAASSSRNTHDRIDSPLNTAASPTVNSSELTCKVCLDEPVSVTYVPCGHLVSCASCASALFECPVCRATIRGTIKTFF